MKTVLIDIDGSVSVIVGKALSLHTNLTPNNVNIFEAPADFDFIKYAYVVIVPNVYDMNNFILLPQDNQEVNFAKRQSNVNSMSNYMAGFITQGTLTQNSFDLFLSDTASLVQGYLGGGSRLITWIETVNRNGYNATNVGFKTRTAYRGTLSNGIYPRAEFILSILNDL
jgi:hypothetical protein